MLFYEIYLVGLHIIAFLIFCTFCLLVYEVVLAACVVVVVHCRQVWSVVFMPAGRKANAVSYLVYHRVWIEELASYLDREVWRGTLPTATNTTLSKVHRTAKRHASCRIVCQPSWVRKDRKAVSADNERKVSDLDAWRKTTVKCMIFTPPQTA